MKKCIVCDKEFESKINHPRFKYCCNKCKDLYRINKLKTPIQLKKYNIIDKNNFIIYCNNKQIDKKQLFIYSCDECNAKFKTCINYLEKKEFKWLCKSCSYKHSWKKNEYRKIHVDGMYKSMTPERRKKISIHSKQNWENIDIRNKMVESMNKPEVIKKKMLVGKNICKKYKRIHAYNCSFRSTYEYRVAKVLIENNIKWKFESIYFKIKKLNSLYFPDFYLPEYNIWLETKGYWRKESLEKFKEFKKQYTNINIKVLYLKDIEKLENGDLSEITI